MELNFAQALWVLDLLSADKLAEIGVKALEAGMDSSALRMLASLSPSEVDEAPQLFARALAELGLAAMSRPEAARICAAHISQQILNGETSSRDGAKKLWDVSLHVEDKGFHDLDTFIYAASEIEDRPEDRDFFDREIVKEARSWATGNRGAS